VKGLPSNLEEILERNLTGLCLVGGSIIKDEKRKLLKVREKKQDSSSDEKETPERLSLRGIVVKKRNELGKKRQAKEIRIMEKRGTKKSRAEPKSFKRD